MALKPQAQELKLIETGPERRLPKAPVFTHRLSIESLNIYHSRREKAPEVFTPIPEVCQSVLAEALSKRLSRFKRNERYEADLAENLVQNHPPASCMTYAW